MLVHFIFASSYRILCLFFIYNDGNTHQYTLSLSFCISTLNRIDPPGFLFDAIPSGPNRRWAGLFLWIHVVVSYAINSQAICSSMDRLFFQREEIVGTISQWSDSYRWMVLTGMMALSAFFVANAIPFFKDLVALIGALTSVPLTLLLPAIYHRRVKKFPLWYPTGDSLASYGLLIFSLVFMVAALIGSIDSIGTDWQHHTGGFFACGGE